MSPKFQEAFEFANKLHSAQTRKETNIPYITHLMSVAALVLENGGDEEQAIAGLLHDSIEDQAEAFGGVDLLREKIRASFGERVLEIVNGCTDADTFPKPPWQARKEAYLTSLRGKKKDILLVSLADKVHNARSILQDCRTIGVSAFDRFTGKQDGTLWYYRELVHIFSENIQSPLVYELEKTVAEVEKIAKK